MKKIVGISLFALLFLSSGCITIDHEIYLKKDGSGLFSMHITVPNPPKEETEAGPPIPQEKEKVDIEHIKSVVQEKNLKGIKIEKVKEIKKNDLIQLYFLFSFDTIKNLEHALSVLYKESVENPKEGKIASEKEPSVFWKIDYNEQGTQKTLHISYKLDLSLDEPKKTTDKEEKDSAGFEEIGKMMISTAKVRFMFHLPSKVLQSNADIVTDTQAVWEAALSIFLDKARTLEMQASF